MPAIMNMSERDFEKEILRELRPEIDSARRLIDVIDQENRESAPVILDDRLIKFLERRYGLRLQAKTFRKMNEFNSRFIKECEELLKEKQVMKPHHNRKEQLAEMRQARQSKLMEQQLQEAAVKRGLGYKDDYLDRYSNVQAFSGATGNRLAAAKSDMLQKLTEAAPATATQSCLEKSKSKDPRRELFALMNQLDVSDHARNMRETHCLQAKLTKERQRQKSQDLEQFEADAYHNIIKQKRKSMAASEAREARTLRDIIAERFDQAIEVKAAPRKQLPQDLKQS